MKRVVIVSLVCVLASFHYSWGYQAESPQSSEGLVEVLTDIITAPCSLLAVCLGMESGAPCTYPQKQRLTCVPVKKPCQPPRTGSYHQKGSEPNQATKSATSIPRCISTAAWLAASNPALRSTCINAERSPADPDPRPAGNNQERGPASERSAPWATDGPAKAPGYFAWSERTDAGAWDSQATHNP